MVDEHFLVVSCGPYATRCGFSHDAVDMEKARILWKPKPFVSEWLRRKQENKPKDMTGYITGR